jgi:hypothetical protein
MKLRIDTAGVSFVCTRAPEPRIAFDTGQAKTDRETGLPLWQVQLMALDTSGGDVIAVTVAGDPNVTVGQPVQVDGLVALPWSQEGRSGMHSGPTRSGRRVPRWLGSSPHPGPPRPPAPPEARASPPPNRLVDR